MTLSKAAQAEMVEERRKSLYALRDLVKPGDTLYTVNRHTSKSGMMRAIDVYAIQDGEPRWISTHAAKVTRRKFSNRWEAVEVSGCGMDMGFDLVYSISQALYPAGFGCIGKGCPSNDHSNGDRDYTPHEDHAHGDPEHICATNPETCTGHKHWHSSGGYALNHRWL